MTEISNLMGQFADKIMEQQTEIEMIHQHAQETTTNIKQVRPSGWPPAGLTWLSYLLLLVEQQDPRADAADRQRLWLYDLLFLFGRGAPLARCPLL